MVLLSASGITKSYAMQEVIKDSSFSVNEGDKVGILGVNGAGKTTLFKMICKMEEPDEGEIYLSSGLSPHTCSSMLTLLLKGVPLRRF